MDAKSVFRESTETAHAPQSVPASRMQAQETSEMREVAAGEAAREQRAVSHLMRLKSAEALASGDIVGALSEVTALSVELLGVEKVWVYQLSAGGEKLDCVHAFATTGSGVPEGSPRRGEALELGPESAYFARLKGEGFLELSPAEEGQPELVRSPEVQGRRFDAAVRLRGLLVGVISFECADPSRALLLWERLLLLALADFLAQVLLVREQLRSEALLQKQQAQVEELLESRTSLAVRENADLQREVDALQLAAETIRKSEDERRKLFATSPVPMLLARRRDQRVVFANERCGETLRCKAGELENRDLRELFAHLSDHRDVLATLEAAGEVDARELQLRGQDGESFWALFSARCMEFGNEDSMLVAFTDLTAQKTVEHQLRTLAQRDALTQAYNRHFFWQLAASELARAHRYKRPLALAMVDADYFKNINDQYGHDVGDIVLCSLVSMCQETLRTSDVLARYGGEEFVVLLPETSAEGAEVVMERLRERVAKTPVVLEDGRQVSLTVSIGLAAFEETDVNVEQLIKRADEAVYAAKRGGRNRVVQR